MNLYLVDDDQSIRAMLTDIIENDELGQIVGEAGDGADVDGDTLTHLQTDILLIDLLMPERDGLETIQEIRPAYKGKIIMISQVETKNMIGEAYFIGVEYYITKPLNRIEVQSVIKKVTEKILLEKSISEIHKSLHFLDQQQGAAVSKQPQLKKDIISCGKELLLEFGIHAESGHKDLLEILNILYEDEYKGYKDFPPLKELFERVSKRHSHCEDLKREGKSSEQRVRRAIHQALEHVASLGLTDYTNPKFEEYAAKYFDYTQVRLKMLELQNPVKNNFDHARVNIKKFIQIFYMEARERMND